jgi:hypothetical protein
MRKKFNNHKLIEEQGQKNKEILKKIQDENDLTPKSNAIWSSVKSPSIIKLSNLSREDNNPSNLNYSYFSDINDINNNNNNNAAI